jgi:tRNA(Ile)-lysidine synthase
VKRAGGAVRPKISEFGPAWLRERLARLLPDGRDPPLAVAFSGGADSTALLAALAQLPGRRRRLRAIHIDHGLHADSAAWSRHAAQVARSLGVPFVARATHVPRARGESLEAAARTLRYRLLGEVLAAGEVLLTAHTQDDQLETVLLQLLRGAGVAGIAAMPEIAPLAGGWLVRPLLPRARAELRDWLAGEGLAWVEDPSNADLALDRNYLRARVLPPIRARWPGAGTTVARAARYAAEAQRLLDGLARADIGHASHGAHLSVPALRTLSAERRRNALRYWIAAAGLGVPPARRLEEIAGPMLAARADAQPFVEWQGARVQRAAGLLELTATGTRGRESPPARDGQITWAWREAPVCALGEGCGELLIRPAAHGPLDTAALPEALSVRWRRGGERLRPVRGGPRRTLKSLLQEAHVLPAERARLPLLYAGARLIAVADLWLDESVRATRASAARARLAWRYPGRGMCYPVLPSSLPRGFRKGASSRGGKSSRLKL